MNITELKRTITQQLSPHSDSPALDAELLLMCALNKSRTQLYTSLNEVITETDELNALVTRRCKKEPIAYIVGHQAFWTLDLLVTQDTLIPRPETECLVDWILTHFATQESLAIADLGTGSGAIAIALATEKPQWQIDATDESYEALAVAKKNADRYRAKNIAFYQGDWCSALPQKKYDIIVSNPPYIAKDDPHLAQLGFEPEKALVSGDNGLDAISVIAEQAKLFLNAGGYLVMEHGFDQGEAVCVIVKDAGFEEVKNHRDLADVSRFVTGKWG